ncbi:MAG: hypothetical protein EXQ85_03125, partial [Alphaproteobacteria bacterium]|nr:hypothetical protein [Alphaproteobacteria bacterium]
MPRDGSVAENCAAPQKELRFIDLFSGLGGFHQALAGLGHRCVFAAEIDQNLAALYEQNFGIPPA